MWIPFFTKNSNFIKKIDAKSKSSAFSSITEFHKNIFVARTCMKNRASQWLRIRDEKVITSSSLRILLASSLYISDDRISAVGYCKKQLWLYIWFIEHQHQTISCRLSKKMCRNFFLFIAKCDLNQIDIIRWIADFFQYVVAEADCVLRCHHGIFL